MTVADVEKQVRETYLDWKHLLANPRFCRSNTRVAWNRYSGGIVRERVTYEKLVSLIETKQFSFQCGDDGSIFQLLYEFDNGGALELARLGFYQAKLPLTEEESQVTGPLPDFSEVFVPWFRFDYTRKYASGVLHHDSHMHVSGFPHSRFAVSGVPGPRQFVEFVIASCFPDYYREHRLHANGSYRDPETMKTLNVKCLHDSSTGILEHIVHVSVP